MARIDGGRLGQREVRGVTHYALVFARAAQSASDCRSSDTAFERRLRFPARNWPRLSTVIPRWCPARSPRRGLWRPAAPRRKAALPELARRRPEPFPAPPPPQSVRPRYIRIAPPNSAARHGLVAERRGRVPNTRPAAKELLRAGGRTERGPLVRCRVVRFAVRPRQSPPGTRGNTHGTQQDRADRRRPDRRHAGPLGRSQGIGRCRPVRHRRGGAAGQGARHCPGVADRGLRRRDYRSQRLRRDQGRRCRDRHRRRAAQARHEPRRSDRDQHQGRRRGRRRDQGERARTPLSSRSPIRSTRWSGS